MQGDVRLCAGQAASGRPAARARTRQLTVGITLLAVRCGTPLKPSSRNGISNSSSMSLAAAAALSRERPCEKRGCHAVSERARRRDPRSGTLP